MKSKNGALALLHNWRRRRRRKTQITPRTFVPPPHVPICQPATRKHGAIRKVQKDLRQNKRRLHTVLWRQCEVVVEELAELHDHVGEARVRDVVVGVVLLRNPPGRERKVQSDILRIISMTFRFAHPEFKKSKRNSNFNCKKSGIFWWEKSVNLFNLI